MQQTTLGCDWCQAGRNGLRPFAVTTRTLGNGKPRDDDPTLDLCKKHDRELTQTFQPKKGIGRPVGSTNEKGHKQEVDARAKRHEGLWEEREQRMLGALKGEVDGLVGPDLCKAAKMSKHYVYKVANRLLEAGKVKRVGEDGERRGFVLA